MLNSFKTSNGTLFNCGIVRSRRVKITAKDLRAGVSTNRGSAVPVAGRSPKTGLTILWG